MSSMTKKKYKICRRLGVGVFDQCQSPKFLVAQAKKAKTKGRRSRVTDYGLSLIEKQKIRVGYGLRERQFRNYVDESLNSGAAQTSPARLLYQILESRLDTLIYRAGFAHTRGLAKQLASHGHFLVNGRRVTVPSTRLKKGDVISIRESSKNLVIFEEASKRLKSTKAPGWLRVDDKNLAVTVDGVADTPDPFFNFQAVIEFYSR